MTARPSDRAIAEAFYEAAAAIGPIEPVSSTLAVIEDRAREIDAKPVDGLRPCPFCGKSEAVRLCNSRGEYVVACDASTASGLGGCGGASGYDDDADGAVDAWNRREGRG